MIDFEFFEHGGTMRTVEVAKAGEGFVAALADNPETRAQGADRQTAVALLKQQLQAPQAPAALPVRPTKPPPRRLDRPGRVLVVDDNPVALEVAMLVCQHGGHVAVGARDGQEAWYLLETGPIDLVLTDLHMPGVGGLALVHAVRKHRPTLPILAVTGAGPNGIRALQQLGVDGVVRKPYAVKELADAIAGVIVR